MKIFAPIPDLVKVGFAFTLSLSAAVGLALLPTLSADAGESCPNGNCDVNTPINTGGSKPSNSAVHLQPPSTNIGNSNTGQGTGIVTQGQSAFMTNQQYNLQGSYPEYGFGPGISCPDIGLTIAGTSSMGGGGGVYNWSDTMVMGGAVALNIPLGSSGKICRDFARTIALQRRLDTCIGIDKSNLEIDYAKLQAEDPALFESLKHCQYVKAKTAVVAPVPEPAPAPVPEPPAPAPVYSAPPTKVLY